jgi:hypothetical protein
MPTGNSTSNKISTAYTAPKPWFQSSRTQMKLRRLRKDRYAGDRALAKTGVTTLEL